MKKILAGVILSLSLAGCGVGVDEAQVADPTASTEQALTCRIKGAKCNFTLALCCPGLVCAGSMFGNICY